MSCLAAQDGKLVTNKVHSRALSPSLCTRLSQILQTLLFLSLPGSCFFAFERAPHKDVSLLSAHRALQLTHQINVISSTERMCFSALQQNHSGTIGSVQRIFSINVAEQALASEQGQANQSWEGDGKCFFWKTGFPRN